MAYCTLDNIRGEFKNLVINEDTLIKASQVESFIVEIDALINAYISGRYVIPANGSSLVTLISRTLVAERIKKILETKNEKPNDGANQSVRGFTSTNAMKLLGDIKNGTLDLDAGTLLISDANGFYSSNYQNGVEPVFKKDEKQW